MNAEKPKPTHVSIPIETVNKVLTCINVAAHARPHHEIASLIAEFQGAAEASLTQQQEPNG